MKVVWFCPECNWVCISDSSIRHCMDICKCGKTGMDLEEYYCRFQGQPIRLAVFKNGKWTRKRK